MHIIIKALDAQCNNCVDIVTDFLWSELENKLLLKFYLPKFVLFHLFWKQVFQKPETSLQVSHIGAFNGDLCVYVWEYYK